MNRLGWGKDDHGFDYELANHVNGLSHVDEIWPEIMA